MIYDNFDELGKSNIKTTRTDFTSTTGVDGMKDIIRKVLLGGNVRDITEFITQRRLLSSYAATLDLFVNALKDKTHDIQEFTDFVAYDLRHARNSEQKTLNLWLMGLTKKGLDNIVRDESNLAIYKDSFAVSIMETIADLQEKFGDLSGKLSLNGVEIDLNWNVFSLLCIALGSQTLSIRGSAKSMNGKLFEKLILGSLLTIIGFRYCEVPPADIQRMDKLFWLSNMDENEREIDATVVHNGKAISIDIGFIGKGNPEISLDKVTRFNRYKQIAGMGHEMKTIIIVDTVAENSDLFNKAERVDGIVLQMSQNDWAIDFSKAVCKIFSIQHPLSSLRVNQLDSYLRREMENVNISAFIE
ncbi:MAG TPA: CfrBI family restriction endonuclease [Clostridiales bacterium]|nr:CfrBI family restriction endonuclease [Clostridiales bacterium]